MKQLLFTVMLMVSTLPYAQQPKTYEKPDYTLIEKGVKDKHSVFYYPNLLSKFNNADATMTLEERRYLYYGFIYQDKYAYSYPSDEAKKLKAVFQKETIPETDYDSIMKYCTAILEKNPFDLRAMNYQRTVYSKRGQQDKMMQRVNQIKMISEAILSSGTGISKEEAYYVINISHEYDILGISGFKFGGSQTLIDTYDYLTLKENDKNIKGLYFDISPSLNLMNDALQKEIKVPYSKTDLVGSWKVVAIPETSNNKNIAQLINGFKNSLFVFTNEGVFHFKSNDKSKGMLEFIKMMGTSHWLFNAKDATVSIGSKQDGFSLMKFKIEHLEGNTVFSVVDGGALSLTLMVEKQ